MARKIYSDDSFARRWSDEVARMGFLMKPTCLARCTAELGLKPQEALVLDHLFSFWFDYTKPPEAWPSERSIAQKLGMGYSTVGRHMMNLDHKGFIRREEREGQSNKYHLEGTLYIVKNHVLRRHPLKDEEAPPQNWGG